MLLSLFTRRPKKTPPEHDWKFEGGNTYRYRIRDGQIRGKIEPVQDGNCRVETAHGFKAVYIDVNHAFDALEKAFP